jgi:hypothetical protein
MADYIRFRLTAAKAGASMALLALIGGLAARGDASPPTLNAVPAKASTGSFLKLGGITGNAKTSFLKIQIINNSGLTLEAVMDGVTTPLKLIPGATLLPAVQHQNAGELHIQIMPSAAFNQVVTLVLGVAPSFADGSVRATGQMLIGLL